MKGITFIDRLKMFIAKERSLPEEAFRASMTIDAVSIEAMKIPRVTGEFWTARQRQAASIHEISYRACFKAQLPAFFIAMLSNNGDVIYDPFSGRGTTAVEAALRGRRVIANDFNPLSVILARPRLSPPTPEAIRERLMEIPYEKGLRAGMDLSMFFHPETESEIVSLKRYLRHRKESGKYDARDAWIQMVATNRLTGHSPGFFSVYTLPPNQATTPARQRRINVRRNQTPDYRDTRERILKKTKALVKNLTARQLRNLEISRKSAVFLTRDAAHTPEIAANSVQLTVTSPPFLDIVDYRMDNWLRCWFNDIDPDTIANALRFSGSLSEWTATMQRVFRELYRITRPGGWVAFEVGEVRRGAVRLEEHAVPLAHAAGFTPICILINSQSFTKTSNIWGIHNNSRGTNSNRICIFFKQ